MLKNKSASVMKSKSVWWEDNSIKWWKQSATSITCVPTPQTITKDKGKELWQALLKTAGASISIPYENKNHFPQSYILKNSSKWMTKLESPVETPTKAWLNNYISS